MLEYEIIVFLQLVLLAAVIILREPKLLIPCVVLGLPFEYVATQTLSSLGESGTGGIIRTLLNPGKAAMLATVGIAIIRARHNPRKLFPDSEIMLPLAVLTAVVFLGVAWSDSMRPSNGVLIMPMYVAFVFAAPSLIEDRKDLERIVAAFLIAAALLSVVAIAQRVLGVFQWRAILVQSDDYSYRSNAFFADPNNLARFLAISMALAAGLIMVTGPRRMTVYLAAPMFAVSAAGIVTTASRSGWLGMLLASFLVVMMSPIRGYTKARLTVVAFGGLVFLLALVFMQGGANAERVKSLTSGIQLIGQREFLIKGGWEMWKDNPLVGVGSGNYQHTLITSYLWTLPWWAKTTLSHTSFISILAELGIVGVGILGLFALRVGAACRSAFRLHGDRYSRLLSAWCAAALVEILFQSQSEGRLLEEPFLYLVFAILIAVELGAGSRGPDPVVEPVPETAPSTGDPSLVRTPAPAATASPATG
ncbi:MAG: O-antigen ligase family protein [Dehalococcoidia bacterium]|nr:O-antigen ligase family protein [Dehalococcoidia bacterium]